MLSFLKRKKEEIDSPLWIKCEKCKALLFKGELEKNLWVCPKCGYHFKINVKERLFSLFDNHEYEILDENILPLDPLNFVDTKPYIERIKEAQKKTSFNEAVINAFGKILENPVLVSCFNFDFMGGSMGSVVGEKLARNIERAAEKKIPFICICASGGARMQEGIFSLMQMAKVSATLTKLEEAKVPYISILTHPTMGGVSASIAFLGDVILAEPGALIGFAGPRVIEQTIKQKLPKDFQTAEFLLKHGLIDGVVDRRKLRETLAKYIEAMTYCF